MSDPRALRRPTTLAGITLCIALAWPAFAAPPASAAGGSDTLWAWGDDRQGQLGVGGSTMQVTPKRVLNGVASIAGGDWFSLASDVQGRAWSWGGNGDGQLGDGTQNDRGTPITLSTLPDVTSVAAGVEHSLILTADGSVQAFGYNSYGNLGTGVFSGRQFSPVDVVGLDSVVITAISVGRDHSVALDSGGVVWTWGQNSDGQLGDGTTLDSAHPISLADSGMPRIVQVRAAALGDHTVAVDENGHVWTWGETKWGPNTAGLESRSTPGMVTGLENIVAVAAGRKFVTALDSDGVVYTWGFNGSGQLGDGSTTPHETPAPVDTTSGLADVVEVCTGFEHVLARTSTGELWAFGRNNRGQLGDGTVEDAPTPVRVQVPPDSVVACAAGDDHSLAVDASGGLWTWGGNSDGQLGDRRVESRVSPVRALGPAGASAIVASGDYYSGWHSLAIDDAGALWSWGFNQNGQLGDGTRIARGAPARVDLARVVVTAAVGPSHSLAVDSSGDVWAWGSNMAGQLGDGTTGDSATPIRVLGLPPGSRAIAVAAGYGHSAALLDDGTVWAWGVNQSGQLGRDFGLLPDGTRVGSLTPVQVPGLPVITNLSSNSGSNLARDVDGNVWGWGDNRWGQFGLPETEFQPSALQVTGLSMIEEVSLGGQHGLARDVNGDVWAWGANGFGQAGEVPGPDLVAPHVVAGVSGASQISAGADHNLAVTSGGELWAWGGNARGQLGDGTTVARSTPLRVGQATGVSAISAGGGFSLALAGPERTTTQVVTAGGAVTTDPQGLGATVGDPIQVAVASPNAGTVTIVEQDATGSVAGYALLGKQMVITAPDGTPADPLVFVFEVDASIVPLGQDASSLVLLRNGVAVPDCAAGATDASPDPCIALRETLLTGNLRLTVRTSQASLWNVAVSTMPNNTGPQVELGDDVALVAGDQWSRGGQIVDPDPGDGWTATVDYGAGVETLIVDASGEFTLSHVYADAGAFTVAVTVNDAAGASATDSLTVEVQSRKDAVLTGFDGLVAAQGIPERIAKPLRVTLSAAATLAERNRGPAARVTMAAFRVQVGAALLSRKITRGQAQALNGFASSAADTLGL